MLNGWGALVGYSPETPKRPLWGYALLRAVRRYPPHFGNGYGHTTLWSLDPGCEFGTVNIDNKAYYARTHLCLVSRTDLQKGVVPRGLDMCTGSSRL